MHADAIMLISMHDLQKAMSVRQLRFARDHYTPEEIAHLLNFVFATMEFADGDEHTSMWSGQVKLHSMYGENLPLTLLSQT